MARQLLLLLLLLLGVGCSPDTPRDRSPLVDTSGGMVDVILLALDTVRADHFGCYGNAEVQTPNVDRLAAQSVLFEDCGAPATWTLPSFSSFYTGRLPVDHGAIGEGSLRPSEQWPMLAEILAARGHATRAFVGVDFLTDHFGLDRGFDFSVIALESQVTGRWNSYSSYIFELLREPPEQPLLVLSHWFDAHDPYAPPPPFRQMYYQGDPFAPPADPARDIEVIYSDRNRVEGDPRRRYRWLSQVKDLQLPVKEYAAGITHVDAMVGTLLDSLDRSERFRDSIVVLMADHGEHLTEHDLYFTHRFPYEECLHVPLLIRLPHGRLAGTRVAQPVSLVDVLPTLAELLGLSLEQEFEGRSLVPLMRGEPWEKRVLFAEYGTPDGDWAKAVWDDEFRYIEFLEEGRRSAELYDRRADRRETMNLLERRPEVAARMRAHLDARFGPERRRLAVDVEPDATMDPEVEERLRALGYID